MMVCALRSWGLCGKTKERAINLFCAKKVSSSHAHPLIGREVISPAISPILHTPQNAPQNNPAPDKATIASIGGVEGIYDLIKNGTDTEKEVFIDLAQGF